jgi:hypothetical protein
MDGFVHIGATAKRLWVTPRHSRVLERKRRVLPATRTFDGPVCSESDIALLRSMGVGSRPPRLKQPEEVMKVAE